MMDKVRVAVIGLGGMGVSHAERLAKGEIEGAVLGAVCDRDASRMAAYAPELRFTDSQEMMASGRVDAVLIATPHYFHTTIGMAALQAGLHVLVEKPISVHKADAERLLAAHSDQRLVCAAMFNMRVNPLYAKLKALIDAGALGEIRRVQWTATSWFRTQAYYNSSAWRATWKGEGGGILLNQAPHQLDMLYWLFGMPARVRAFCRLGFYHHIEVEDDVTAYLEYPNGSTGLFVATTGEAPGSNRLEISAENGRILIEGAREDTIHFLRNETPMTAFCQTSRDMFKRPDTWDVSIPVPAGTFANHRVLIQNFVDAIRRQTPLIAPAAEGIHSVELANAMLYSSLTEATIDLPLDGALYEKKLQELIATSTFEKQVDSNVTGDLSQSSA